MSTTSAISGSTNTLTNPKAQLQVGDFINMMVTQLQNQDPTDPVKNSDLLAQMSQIGQLQSSQDLQTSLKSMVLQNSMGSAGNLIGKEVEGQDTDGSKMNGLVNSVSVQGTDVYLNLDSGKALKLANVTSISQPAGSATATPPAPATH